MSLCTATPWGVSRGRTAESPDGWQSLFFILEIIAKELCNCILLFRSGSWLQKSNICICLLIGTLLWCFRQQHGGIESTALRHLHLGKQLSELIQSPVAGLFHQLSKKRMVAYFAVCTCCSSKRWGKINSRVLWEFCSIPCDQHQGNTRTLMQRLQTEAVYIARGCVWMESK